MREEACIFCAASLLCVVSSGFGHQIRVIKQFDGDTFDNPLGYEEECLAAGALCAVIDEPLRFCNETQSPPTNCSACKCDAVTPVYNSTSSECQAGSKSREWVTCALCGILILFLTLFILPHLRRGTMSCANWI